MTGLLEPAVTEGWGVTSEDVSGQALSLPIALEPASAAPAGERGGRGFVRDRPHRLPGRKHALKVLYDDVEVTGCPFRGGDSGADTDGFRGGRRPDLGRGECAAREFGGAAAAAAAHGAAAWCSRTGRADR
jgi:hypothetical protein